MKTRFYEIKRIPDLTLSKYSALDEDGVDGVLTKHAAFLRQLHRQAMISKETIHWIFEYNPKVPKGERLKIFLKFDTDSFSRYAETLITNSPLAPYFDIRSVFLKEQIEPYRNWLSSLPDGDETKAIDLKRKDKDLELRIDLQQNYEYMAVMIKREKFAKADKEEFGYFYSVNEWKMNEDARLFGLYTMLQKMNQQCVYCVDVEPADYTNRIEEPDMLGNILKALRNVLTMRVEKSTGGTTTFQKDESADYTMKRYKDLIKDVAANPHFNANVRVYAHSPEYASMLLDAAASEALEEGSHDIVINRGSFNIQDITNSRVEFFANKNAPKELCFWPTMFLLEELVPFVTFPALFSGESIEIPKETAPSYDSSGLHLGKDNDGFDVYIPYKNLPKHAFLAGVPGSGKTNSMLHIATELHRADIPFLILEPAKQEYRALLNIKEMGDITVFSPSSGTKFPLHINPFQFPKGMALAEHIRALQTVFEGSFTLEPPMPFLLDRGIERVYRDKNWLPYSINTGKLPYPTMGELYKVMEKLVEEVDYEADIKGNLKSALQVRIGSLITREMGDVFDVETSTFSPEEWLHNSAVIELEAMGSGPANFLTLMLSTLIRETLKVNPVTDVSQKNKPRHVIFFEEAHNLLGPETQAPAGADADPKIAATAFVVKMLAEVRALNEAIIIADQLPTVMAPEVIKNTSLKLGHRITAQDDRALLGSTMSADDVQLERMASFTTGKTLAIYEGLLKPFELQMAKWQDDDDLFISPNNDKLFELLYNSENDLFRKTLERSFQISEVKFNKMWRDAVEKRLELDKKTCDLLDMKKKYLARADFFNKNIAGNKSVSQEDKDKCGLQISLEAKKILDIQVGLTTEFEEVVSDFQEVIFRIRSYMIQNKAYVEKLRVKGNAGLEEINNYIEYMEKQFGIKYKEELKQNFLLRMSLWDK